ETKSEPGLGIDPLDEIVEITPPNRRQPRSFSARKRPFAEKPGAGAAQTGASMKLVSAPFACRQVDFGSHLAAGSLWIASRQQGPAARRSAVDHGNRQATNDAGDR